MRDEFGKLRVLLIEDSTEDHKIVERALKQHDLVIAHDDPEARRLLMVDNFVEDLDVVVLDGSLTASGGWDTETLLYCLRYVHGFRGLVVGVSSSPSTLQKMEATKCCEHALLKSGNYGPELLKLLKKPAEPATQEALTV